MKKRIVFFIVSIIAFLCIACGEKEVLENEKINVMVSRDFGAEKLHDQTIDYIEDLNVMEVMEENFHIETAYGGGFINAIDGLKSGFTGMKEKKKTDWFYYVNGISAEVGAEDYYLEPEDMVIWDYHDWSKASVSSIIGAYPINFVNGHEGNRLKTEILYEKKYKKECEELLEYLDEEGVKEVDLKEINEKELKNGEINSIVVSSWDEIYKLDTIKEFYKNGDKLGIFFKIDNHIKALDDHGEIVKEYKKGAVITSFVKQYGLTGSLWMVTGNDEECIKKAVKILYESPEKIKGKVSVLVTEDKVLNIPVKK